MLSAHLRMWGSRLPAHLRDGSALGPIVQQLLEVIEFQFDEIPSWSKAAGALGELADDAGRAIGAMGAGTDGRRALDLLHIDVNRLGLNPPASARGRRAPGPALSRCRVTTSVALSIKRQVVHGVSMKGSEVYMRCS